MAKLSYVKSAAKALYGATMALKESEAVEVVKRLVALLKKNDRLDLAPLILAAYDKFASKKGDSVRITTADALSASAANAVRKALGDEIVLELKEDPSLIAGAVIRHCDTLLDASVKRKLELLKISLTA